MSGGSNTAIVQTSDGR